MNNTQYHNGYWDKLSHWNGVLTEAIKNNDSLLAVKTIDRLIYFVVEQMEYESEERKLNKKNE
jgi:hypothetical protein